MEEQVVRLIRDFVKKYPKPEGRGWKEPLVAFAAADDPLFTSLKKIIHPGHYLPRDLLREAVSVVVFFIPFENKIVKSNIEGRYTSLDWVRCYNETNSLIGEVNTHLQGHLVALGYKASHMPATHNYDEETFLSDWSHRSAAVIAGLGTIGLNHMLITENGCCGRVGSLITSLKLEPTKRPEYEYCLYKRDGSCGKCVEKCVNDALHYDHLDKYQCNRMCLKNGKRFKETEGYSEVCGKCLVNIPCSFNIP